MRYKGKQENLLFYDPSLTHKRGEGVNLTGFIDSPYMESILKL